MNYTIRKNQFLDECEKIFDDNHSTFVQDKSSIKNPKHDKYIYLDKNNNALGYASIYPQKDFLKMENFDCEYDIEDNAIYIWQIVVKKQFCNMGVGSSIIQYILQANLEYPIYCVVDKYNTPSMEMFANLGFFAVKEFKQNFHGIPTTFALLKNNNTTT